LKLEVKKLKRNTIIAHTQKILQSVLDIVVTILQAKQVTKPEFTIARELCIASISLDLKIQRVVDELFNCRAPHVRRSLSF